jgi:hypothetical protein
MIRLTLYAMSLVALAGVVALVLSRGEGTSATVALDGIPGTALNHAGYRLADASAEQASARLSREDAVVLAKREFPGIEPRQMVLGRLTQMLEPYRFTDLLVWAVNVDPATAAGVPSCGSWVQTDACDPEPGLVRYMLVFVDAGSGEVLFAIQTGDETDASRAAQ